MCIRDRILSVQCPRITPLLYSKEGESVLITLTMRFDVVIHSFIPRRIPCYCSNLYRPVGWILCSSKWICGGLERKNLIGPRIPHCWTKPGVSTNIPGQFHHSVKLWGKQRSWADPNVRGNFHWNHNHYHHLLHFHSQSISLHSSLHTWSQVGQSPSWPSCSCLSPKPSASSTSSPSPLTHCTCARCSVWRLSNATGVSLQQAADGAT